MSLDIIGWFFYFDVFLKSNQKWQFYEYDVCKRIQKE